MHTLYLYITEQSWILCDANETFVGIFTTFGDAYDYALSHGFAVEAMI